MWTTATKTCSRVHLKHPTFTFRAPRFSAARCSAVRCRSPVQRDRSARFFNNLVLSMGWRLRSFYESLVSCGNPFYNKIMHPSLFKTNHLHIEKNPLWKRGFDLQYHLNTLQLNLKSTKGEHQQRFSNKVPKKKSILLRTFPPFKSTPFFRWFRPLPSLQAMDSTLSKDLSFFFAKFPCKTDMFSGIAHGYIITITLTLQVSAPKPRRGVACFLHHHKNRQAAPKLLSRPDFGCPKQLPKPAGSFLSYKSRSNQSHHQTLNHESCPNFRLSNSNFEAPNKTTRRTTYFQISTVFSASPLKRRPLSFLVRAGPVVDSFDLPHRCCPALELLLGVSFPTKTRGSSACFFWKDSRRLRGAHFVYLKWQMEKCTNWSDLCFSTPRNDHDFRIFVPSSGRKANVFGSRIFKQCKEQETF